MDDEDAAYYLRLENLRYVRWGRRRMNSVFAISWVLT